MYTDTKNQLLLLLEDQGEMSPHQLAIKLGIGKVALHRHLKSLMQEGTIVKLGKAPRTFYALAQKKKLPVAPVLKDNQITYNSTLKDFVIVDSIGRLIEGAEAFRIWCAQRELSFEKMLPQFIKTTQKYAQFKDEYGLIDGTAKLTETFGEIALDQVFYLDFYSWEIFGKTRLGTLLLYAKQSQNLSLAYQLIQETNQRVFSLIAREKIQALAFIPPSEKREVQIMKLMGNFMNPGLPKVEIFKLQSEIIQPQKSLSSLKERVINAESTFAVDGASQTFERMLLIDDAIGSGATMNAIAKKLRQKGFGKERLIGLALAGSFKGFDVISRV